MKQKIKLWARRLILRWLRKLVDLVDDRLHATEVRFREAHLSVHGEDPAPRFSQLEKASMSNPFPIAAPAIRHRGFTERPARPGAPVRSGKTRRHVTAADFDRRFA